MQVSWLIIGLLFFITPCFSSQIALTVNGVPLLESTIQDQWKRDRARQIKSSRKEVMDRLVLFETRDTRGQQEKPPQSA